MKVIRKVRTPGNRLVEHIRPKKPNKHHCGICGSVLHGVPRGTSSEIRKLTKSKRRPTRPFGGVLCSQCTRKVIKLRAQLKAGIVSEKEIPISLKKYVQN